VPVAAADLFSRESQSLSRYDATVNAMSNPDGMPFALDPMIPDTQKRQPQCRRFRKNPEE